MNESHPDGQSCAEAARRGSGLRRQGRGNFGTVRAVHLHEVAPPAILWPVNKSSRHHGKARPKMICRSELKRLQGQNDYPSISLLAPTHRTAPANQRDRIVVKNLVAEGLDRLHGEFKKREVAPLVQNLNKLVDRVDWEHALEGLALFASRDVATAVQLPFRVKARVVIDATFATRDLVFTLNRSPRYRVLVLTEKPTRLFDATTNVLTEVTNKPFPMVHKGPGGASRLPGRPGDQSVRRAGRVAPASSSARWTRPSPRSRRRTTSPWCVVGVERYLAFYQEVTKDPDAIVGVVAGSHDDPNPAALGKLVWPVFKAGATLEADPGPRPASTRR